MLWGWTFKAFKRSGNWGYLIKRPSGRQSVKILGVWDAHSADFSVVRCYKLTQHDVAECRNVNNTAVRTFSHSDNYNISFASYRTLEICVMHEQSQSLILIGYKPFSERPIGIQNSNSGPTKTLKRTCILKVEVSFSPRGGVRSLPKYWVLSHSWIP